MSAYMNGGTPTHTAITTIKMENDVSSLDDGSTEVYNGTLILSPQNIKSEPPLDINDGYEHDSNINNAANVNNNVMMLMNKVLEECPKIRLKPTSKLMPCPNPTDPKRRFICPFENCTKAYGKSSHLRSHLTWHTGIKPFVCKEANCGRGFTRSDELNRHVRTHTGEKPFECIQCTKKFSRSDHLTKHLATHAKQLNGNNVKRASTNSGTVNNEQQQSLQNQEQGQLTPAQQHVQRQQQQQQQQQIQQQNQQRRQQQQARQLEYNLQQERLQRMTNQKRLEERQQKQHQSQSQNSERTDATAVVTTVSAGVAAAAVSDNNHLQFSDGMHFMAALISGNDPLGDGENETDAVEKLENLTSSSSSSASLQIKEERPEINDSDFEMMPHPHQQHHQQQLQRQYQQNERNAPANINESEDDIPPELIMPVSTMICPLSPITRPHDPNDDQIMPEANAIISISKFDNNNKFMHDRPFRCIHCEKSFKRADDLNRHVRTHTGEKPFACLECSRRFMRGDHLKKHMRTHTKTR